MMAKPPEMSAEFARWYADAFMDEGSTRESRWKGVVETASKPELKTIEVLARLAFPTSLPARGTKNEDLGATYDAITSTISGEDPAFIPANCDRELQLLAAAALEQMFAKSAGAAIAVVTTSFAGARKPELPMDLPTLAQKALVSLSHRQHVRTDAKALQSIAPKLDFTVTPEALQSMDSTLWSGEFGRMRDAIGSAFNSVVTGQNRLLGALHKRIVLDEEELQILWWLIGGFSRHLDKRFTDIDPNLRVLRLAYELGEMTSISPGPASFGAILTKAGVGLDDVTVQDVVNAVDVEWAKEVSDTKRVSPVTTPIHFALEKRGELGSVDTWQPGWTGMTGVPATMPLPAARLAELFYREHLFLYVGD